jgi:hypothetical protein
MKSSRAISRVRTELISNVSETVFVSIIRVGDEWHEYLLYLSLGARCPCSWAQQQGNSWRSQAVRHRKNSWRSQAVRHRNVSVRFPVESGLDINYILTWLISEKTSLHSVAVKAPNHMKYIRAILKCILMNRLWVWTQDRVHWTLVNLRIECPPLYSEGPGFESFHGIPRIFVVFSSLSRSNCQDSTK